MKRLIPFALLAALVSTACFVATPNIARAASPSVGSDPNGWVSVGNKVLYAANNGANSWALFVTDGTKAGTHELSLGKSGGFLLQMVSTGKEAYFAGELDASSLSHSRLSTTKRTGELWKSDGTQAGTKIVQTFASPITGPWNVTAVGTNVFFETSNSHTADVWKSDGTAKGTKDLGTILLGPGSGYHFGYPWFTPVGKTVYFPAYTKAAGRELWKSDGTVAGTGLVKDIRPGAEDSHFSPLAVAGTTLYFSANDGTHGTELWKTDGTANGTKMVKNIAPDSQTLGVQSSNPSQMTVAGTEVFFLACSRVASNRTQCGRGGGSPNEIWKSDGTASGTVEVKQISAREGITYLGNNSQNQPMVLFLGWDHAHGNKLWTSDGTEAGTQIVPNAPSGSYLTRISTGASSFVLYAADSGGSGQLWRTDGTGPGTKVVSSVYPDYLYPATLQGHAGLIFGGRKGSGALMPWFSDGTAGGTKPIT